MDEQFGEEISTQELDLSGSLERALDRINSERPFTIQRLVADRVRPSDSQPIFLSATLDRYRDGQALKDVIRISEWPAIPPDLGYPGGEWGVDEWEGGMLREPRITEDLLKETDEAGERHRVCCLPRLLERKEIKSVLNKVDEVLAESTSGADEAIDSVRQSVGK